MEGIWKSPSGNFLPAGNSLTITSLDHHISLWLYRSVYLFCLHFSFRFLQNESSVSGHTVIKIEKGTQGCALFSVINFLYLFRLNIMAPVLYWPVSKQVVPLDQTFHPLHLFLNNEFKLVQPGPMCRRFFPFWRMNNQWEFNSEESVNTMYPWCGHQKRTGLTDNKVACKKIPFHAAMANLINI